MSSKIPGITIRLPDDLYEKLDQLAERDDRSLNNYIVRVIRQHVESEGSIRRWENIVEPEVSN